MTRNGFSRTSGVRSTTVNGDAGQLPVGACAAPTNTMFQTPPAHEAQSVLRERNCCCVPDDTRPSTSESAMKPPLEYPPSENVSGPLTCIRLKLVPCDTAQISV